MRTITRNAVIVILAVVALLLALGALPSYLKSGDPYYVTATTADATEAVNVSNLSERRFEYTTAAVAAAAAGDGTGRSDSYWRGPFGLKEGFTHSPFDEFDALTRDYPNATAAGDDTRVYAALNGTTYRLDITRAPDAAGDGAGTNGSAALAARGEVSAAEAAEVSG